ncbi:DUF433 domain-containing protein [Saccharothrix coeruleofusca]|uniref:HTH merR-type domain-containing protein n=1 Tax=Saccharothrix coeruleofusca TaxID=33919 RepID=A0A918AMW8_9PSEU|nr:DUF433 domain-containing protein [Saccharothrix coeruleofusca]MBP2338461.1 uncharacterized protein (DUF433 family)/DNA-binding transcriptional MerR regulator [Saccharothrix coeruleofusca]GGP48230.1 hypothetical protein GCM10010185_20220 [Saccharothrix coeruleofusca]
MVFPADVASVLSGASMGQLRHWRNTGLVVPGVADDPALYSYQDVVALRIVMWLRTESTLQRVRKAFANLRAYRFTDHPASYRFGTDGDTIAVRDDDERWTDLVRKPGQTHMFTLAEVFQPFTTRNGREVVDFTRPRGHLRVDANLLGGWPAIEGTRIGFDTVAALVEDGSLTAEDVHHYYPSVPVEAVPDAVSFADSVAAARSGAA